MKTTVEMSDVLLRRAKKLAARRGTTLRAVIEDALRAALEAEEGPRAVAPIRTHTFGGRGLQAGLSWSDWATIRAMSYQGRGG
ncbi:MAG: hypothetical protein A2138_17510 [Deltaproteobacteria bacterium RBG_16_71_12]|nr:MAG: hypothetical protein A2138_17510 [Deltaproteobacteria bacterium RBG_16_71_12]